MNHSTFEGLHSYFLHWHENQPDATALATKNNTFSYREVFCYMVQIADKVSLWDFSSDSVQICLLTEKSVYAYAAQLAVMMKGHIFVPLSMKYPIERNEFIVGHCNAKVLLVDASSLIFGLQIKKNCTQYIEIIEIDKLSPYTDAITLSAPLNFKVDSDKAASICTPIVAREDQLAYIIYTSGTSGTPKGVPVTHLSAVQCIENVFTILETNAADKFSQLAELSFDFSVSEIFLCWKSGGTLCIPSKGDNIAPSSYINHHGITVWSSVPSTIENMEMLGLLKLPNIFPSIKASYFCGSGLKSDVTRKWALAAHNSVIINFYGPTEAAIFATWHIFDEKTDNDPFISIGKPLPGFEITLMAVDSCVSVMTSVGELLLAGPQVSSCYWNNAAATHSSFITLAVDGCHSQHWYRTGDLVQYNGNDDLEFKGRVDHQVKVFGYRVELQEIELVLEKHTHCKRVAVVYAPCNLTDEWQITAFFETQETNIEEQLWRVAKKHLAEYMQPDHIELVPMLPLNANGKLDYQALKSRLREGANKSRM